MLSKKYDAKLTELKLKNFWADNDVYKFNLDNTKPIYSIDTPPPTVSGSLHIGHIFSYTQAEIIARYKRMRGYNVFYPFGFDDNGLPTERLVEKEHKIKASNLKRSEFTSLCYETIDKYENEFRKLWTSLGFSCDWSLLYKTISPLCQKISQKSFIELYNKGLIYREESPTLYCTNCKTSIAQAELESKELPSKFNYLEFQTKSRGIVIATTRPELLNSCICLFVNPDDSRYKDIVGKSATVPLYEFSVPILADERVDINKGTGIVMFCTFGDTTDLDWYREYDFEYKKTINNNGFIYDNVDFIGGLHLTKARAKIINLLSEKGILIKSEDITHSVSIHERCKTEIEILPSQQWYIDILSNKETFIKLADEINWHPDYMKNRYLTWVSNLKWNWCISRQRFFGVPIPIWYCKSCEKIIVADANQLPINPLETKPSQKCDCGCETFIAETAVLDTWATSSTTPLINALWQEDNTLINKLTPMSMRTQAHDIIRTWAFYTIVKSYYHLGIIPWKDIMICGFVLARKGEKISKSVKNSKIDPQKLIANNSADSIRYWAASAKLGSDTTFSELDLKISKRFITKLWNAAKFSIMHLSDFEIAQDITCLPQDKWIINKLMEVKAKVAHYMDNYEIGLARNILDDFFWKDYCDNYLELVKDRLYKPELHGYESRSSAQATVYKALLEIIKCYAIFTPFITEEIYKCFYEKTENSCTIHLLEWDIDENVDLMLLELGEQLKKILMSVRKFKSEKSLSMKSELSKLIIHTPKNLLSYYKDILSDLKATTHAQKIEVIESDKFEVKILR